MKAAEINQKGQNPDVFEHHEDRAESFLLSEPSVEMMDVQIYAHVIAMPALEINLQTQLNLTFARSIYRRCSIGSKWLHI